MATSKILYMKDCGTAFHGKHLKVALQYIMDRKKTQDMRLVAGVNCQPENAFEQMKATKKKFGKMDKRQGYHLIISFVENEVSVDSAFELAGRFVKEYLGDDYEAVYTVHDNTDHVHAHIVFNSVSYRNGRKYRYKKGDWAKYIQPITNRLCEEYGLSTIEIETDQAITQKNQFERNEYKEGRFWGTDMIRRDVDISLVQADSFEQFLVILCEKGYDIKRGKHLAVKCQGMKKYCRLKSLGENYEETKLRERVLQENISTYKVETLEEAERIVYSKIPKGKRANLSGLQKKYYARLYRIGLLQQKPYSQVWKYSEDIRTMRKLQAEYLFLVNHDVQTIEDLSCLKESLTDKKKMVMQEKSQIYKQRKKCSDIFAIASEMNEIELAEKAYQEGDTFFEEEHQKWEELKQTLEQMGYDREEANHLKEHYRSEIARIRDVESVLRKEILVAESLTRELTDSEKNIEKTEEKQIIRNEQPQL